MVAKEEGFDHIAFLFEEVGKIEKDHEERYQRLYNNIKGDKRFFKIQYDMCQKRIIKSKLFWAENVLRKSFVNL